MQYSVAVAASLALLLAPLDLARAQMSGKLLYEQCKAIHTIPQNVKDGRDIDDGAVQNASKVEAFRTISDPSTCGSYISGVIEGMRAAQPPNDKGFCFPQDLTTLQAQLMFEKYAAEHPDALEPAQASTIVVGLLKQAFPCSPAASRPQ